ncbi:pre-toxin TG domain-containing protein [Streptococcus suis]|uniref:pre-toxin TG domain-containing protein n=1 Tax=Streptococcus suis TaxID=1307 RepID=UPI00128FE460|nr:pre-toxin TG domain-containing protein [Streptococcus suis]MCL4880589.1 pre-toxin TG domain-containing protein [Streptococcus suis]
MQNNPANYTDPSGNIRSPHAMFDDRFGGKVYNRPRPLINPDDGTLYAPSTPQHKAHQIRQQQTGNYSYVYTPKVYSNTPIIKPTSYEQAQAQRDRAREQALAEQRRQQNIRNEYSRATGSKGKAKLREAQNLIKNWGKALEETLKHVCNPQTTKGKDSGTRNKPNISVADFRKIEEANKYGLTVAQKERIDKMTLDQYLQSPQMTAEEILYARQVKFASYTEARKDVFPTFVAELSGWNNIQRLKDGVDPTTGEQANRWFAAGELSLDLASNLLPFLKAGKITQVGKILDATDDVVDTFDHVSDVGDITKAGAGVGNPVTILGKGSTGRVVANTLEEQLAMKEVMSNPLANAFEVPITMTDTRWLGTEGWVKMQRVVTLSDGTKINIHYVYNKMTGAFDDFKFK